MNNLYYLEYSPSSFKLSQLVKQNKKYVSFYSGKTPCIQLLYNFNKLSTVVLYEIG